MARDKRSVKDLKVVDLFAILTFKSHEDTTYIFKYFKKLLM